MASTKTAGLPVLSGEQMWALLFGLVAYHELVCDERNLLSTVAAARRRRHPALIYTFTAVTVCHLMDWLPEKYDPYTAAGWRLLQHMKGNR